MNKSRVLDRPSTRNSKPWLCILVAMLLLSNFTSLIRSSHGDPVLQDNGNGTMTARWDFQNPTNYTSQNLSVSPGRVVLERESFKFVDTTMEDFKAGTVHYNVNITSSPGNVTLDNTKVAAAAQIQDIPVDEIGGMDSTLYEIMPSMNYGAATLLDARLSDQVRIVVQFNLSRILDPDWIRRADLHLKMAQTMTAAATNISVHQLNTSWTEGTGTGQPTGNGVTWTFTDGTNTWTTPGGDFNPIPEYVVTDIRDQLTWYRWNITDLVVDWVNGTRQNYGAILIVESAESATERKRFYSKESALVADHPKLSVMYNATGPTSANGTFVSREFDAMTMVNWGDISWDSIVPAKTGLSIQTRTGDCAGSWSTWSDNYSTESGSRITSPANRCLQYKVEMRTSNATLTPILQEVRIENGKSEVDTTQEDFKNGTGFFNVDFESSPGNVTLNDTVLGDPPKILEIPIDSGNGMDAWMDQAFPKKNYGADVVLVLQPGSNSRGLVKFDLSAIPNPQWINRSEVWMRPSPGLTGGIQANISVFQVTTDWIEGTGSGSPSHDGVTWETTDGTTPWTTPGGDFNSVPEFTLMNVTNVPDWHKWNITRLVKEWINGTTLNAGVLFETHFGGFIADEKVFYSKEYAGVADRPKLVVYYNSSGPGQANGTFISRTMDAQSSVNWGGISWDSIVPAQTELFIHTRTGDCLGSWSGWSQAYSSPLGSQITSPPNRCLQYKAEMFTYQNGTSPVLEEVRIDYWRYVQEGSIETENFKPVDWLGWEDFNASFAEPLGTNISFQYSTDAGMFWADVFAGQSLQPLLAQNIMFRANFKTSDPAYTPELYEMNITYRIKDPLDHIHMSLAQWNGTVDDSVDLDAYGHNADHENVSFAQKWETDDPWGLVNSTGFYQPGKVGTWRVFCNNSDDTISNYTKVTIFPGLTADIAISPWDPGTITTDDTLLFNVTGFDSKGNFLGPIIANWSVTGGIGSTMPGPDAFSIFDATTPGVGQVWADDGVGHINSTNMFQVIIGARARVGIEPWSPGTLTTNDTVNFTAYDYDLDGNQMGMANVTWSVNGGIGTIPPGPSETSIFDATTPGIGTVSIDDGLGHTNTTDMITVVPGSISRVEIQPWSPGTLTTDDTVNFTAYAYDMSGILIGALPVTWTVNGGIGTIPLGPSENATFDATTPGVGTVTIDDGLGHTNTTDLITVLTGSTSRVGIVPWSPGPLTTDDIVNFTALAYDADDNLIGPVSVNWSVNGGIGAIPQGPSSAETFEANTPGIGTITIDDGLGHTNTTDNIAVLPGSLASVGIAPWSPGTLTTDENVNFTAYAYDLDGNLIGPALVSWAVTGGIGTIPPGPSNASLFDATTVGIGTVEIDDGLGHTNTTDLITVIEGQLSTIALSPSSVVLNAGEEQNFTAIGYDSNGNQVPLVAPLWETNAGSIINSSDNEATLQAQGTELFGGWVRITATSQNNISANSTVDVVVVDVEPEIIGVIPNQEKREDYGSWSIDLTAFASDAQDPLSSLCWFFTDNDPSLITISGTNNPGNHLITFTTVQNAFGNDEMTIWLRDSDGYVDSQVLWVNITPVNDVPMIQSITPFTVHFDVPYTFYFYDYVSDVETLKSDLVLTADQPDYVTFDGLWGTFLYPQEFNGQTVYPQVTVHDEDGGSMRTVVSVTVSEDYVPVLTRELPDVVLYEGETRLGYFDLDDYFDDPDQDSLYYTSGNIRTQIIIHENHSVDFIAPEDWFGVETVTFRAIDPHNARAEDIVLVTVLPINDAPTISGVPDLVVHYDDPMRPSYNYTFDLEPYIFDIDNTISELTITTSDPTHIFFNQSKNSIMELHYPQSMMGQTVVVRITVSDNSSQDYQDINVTILDNWPPGIIAPIPDLTIYEDIPFPNILVLDDYFFDEDGDDLSYTSISLNVYVQIDPLTSHVSLSSATNWSGHEQVTFRAIDSHGAVFEQTTLVIVIPVNDAPRIDPIPDQRVREGQTYSLDLSAYIFDIDNNMSELVVSIVDSQLDASISVVGTFLIFSYNEEGTDIIQLSVSDGGETVYAQFNIVVVGPSPPTIWDQIFWPWSLLIALLGLTILILLSRQFFLKIHIEEIFLIHRDGNLIKHITLVKESEIDKDIFSGMLTAIQAFIHDSFKEVGDSRIKKIEFGDSRIMIERGHALYMAIVYRGHESRWNVRSLKETIKEIEEKHLDDLEDWDGSMDVMSGIDEIVRANLGDFSRGD